MTDHYNNFFDVFARFNFFSSILFSIIIFVGLFVEFDRHLIKPIKNFISNINYISNNKDVTKRVTLKIK